MLFVFRANIFYMISRIFKCLLGFIILCAIQFACNMFIKIFNIPFPAPIMGIIVLFLLLQLNILKREWIKDICELMLKYMPLLFVPLSVGIVAYYGIIEKNLIPILINVIGTTTLTLLLTAMFVENVIKYVRLHRMRKLKND